MNLPIGHKAYVSLERLLLFTVLTAVIHFAVDAQGAVGRMQLYLAAKSFVEGNSVEEVFEYLERTIPTNGQPTADSPLFPEDVLAHTPRNPSFLPKHLPRFIELAEIDLARRNEATDARAIAFEQFVRQSIIYNLKADQRSVAVAEELNHQIGERFDRALTNWKRLSVKEREMAARLLGNIAVQTAEPEYLGRVAMFAQMATVREFTLFNGSLSSSSGAILAMKAAVAGPYAEMLNGNPAHGFEEWMQKSIPVIDRLWSATIASTALENYNLGERSGRKWTVAQANVSLKTITTDGTRRFIEEALTILESKMPLVDQPGSRDRPAFAELLHSGEFKLSLVRALDRYPELRERIHAIQDRTIEIDRLIGKMRLDQITRDNAKAAAQTRKVLGRGICRDVF